MGKRLLLLPLVNAGIVASFLILGFSKKWDLENTRLVELEIFTKDGEIFLAFLGMMFLALTCNWLLLKVQFRRQELKDCARLLRLIKFPHSHKKNRATIAIRH